MQTRGVVSRLLVGGERGIGGTVYGTVLALAALTAGAAEHLDAGKLLVVVASTAGVIWIAHVYAHGLGESIEQLGMVGTAAAVSANLALGGLVVLLKVLVTHH